MTGLQSFQIVVGDSKTLRITVKDAAGAAVDISGATIAWQASRHIGAGPAVVSKATGSGIAITDGPNGVFEVTLDAADTASLRGDYYHEAEVTLAGKESTVVRGFLLTQPALIA